ncbi:restriction endonuclease subunit S [Achromobacter mucicolens]|uniref:restriction endonuclease subunit S n=1 Tax=Achromobacter mucicolens TaxID=1389922 RepID=UPI002452E1A3|nr:restriction endonuclease subunit S [Achromobacter mucicolens]WGJ91412.1 restriction endonuclease subunit S [Achromobacter mucicolens]
MSSEWPTVRLGDHIESCLGKMLDAKKNKGAYQPYLGNSNVRWGAFDLTNLAEMKFEANEEARYSLEPGDLVVCEGGEPGRCAIWTGKKGMKIQKALHRIRPKKTLNNYYLFYWFVYSSKLGLLEPYFTGTTIKHLTGKAISALELRLPPISTQVAVVAVLKLLDDRITLLHETNKVLESIAQTIFKSWFVDFDPVRAKMEGRQPEGMDEETAASFPDSFEESELGLIPKGWKVTELKNICQTTIGGAWGKDTKEDEQLVPVVSLRGVDLENLRNFGYAQAAPIRWFKPNALEKRRLSENEVLIASSGAGPCGRPLWASLAFEEIYKAPVVFSNFVKRLDCGSPWRAIFIDRVLHNMRNTGEIWNYINGTSIPNLDDGLLLSTKKICLPNEQSLRAYESVSRAIYEKLYSPYAQQLAIARNSLLPRLLSGQLRLPEAQEQVESALP